MIQDVVEEKERVARSNILDTHACSFSRTQHARMLIHSSFRVVGWYNNHHFLPCHVPYEKDMKRITGIKFQNSRFLCEVAFRLKSIDKVTRVVLLRYCNHLHIIRTRTLW